MRIVLFDHTLTTNQQIQINTPQTQHAVLNEAFTANCMTITHTMLLLIDKLTRGNARVHYANRLIESLAFINCMHSRWCATTTMPAQHSKHTHIDRSIFTQNAAIN